MKILADKDLISYVTPAVFSGFSASILDPKLMPVYDSFDIVNPDILIVNSENLSETVVKNKIRSIYDMQQTHSTKRVG